MKKRRTLALLMAGILTASALSIGASAEEAEFTPRTGIEQQEETASEKREKKSADKTSEDGTVKEKKAKKSTDSAEDGTVTEKKAKKSSDSTSETELSQKKHGKKASKTAEPEGVIGKDAAKEAALADAGAEAEGHVRGRYTEKDGTGIYNVTFKAGGQRYKYRIDAMNGEILDKSVTEITE
jgi:uncharacterized membrane protein YkoI